MWKSKSTGNVISKVIFTMNNLYACRSILVPLLFVCYYKFYFTLQYLWSLNSVSVILEMVSRCSCLVSWGTQAGCLEEQSTGMMNFCPSFGTQARMMVTFWTQGCCYLLLSSTQFARTQRKISKGICLTLFPFQHTTSVSKKVRSRLKHISREYHRQHKNRASLYITAAL